MKPTFRPGAGCKPLRAIEALHREPVLCPAELAPLMGVHPRRVHAYLANSIRAGAIVREWSGRRVSYRLAQECRIVETATGDKRATVGVAQAEPIRDVWQYASAA